MFTRIFTLLLALLLCLPPSAQGEIFVFEDEEEDTVFAPTEEPQDSIVEETFTPRPTAAHTPVPERTAEPFETLQYGASGDNVLAAQTMHTELGYYHGKCSGDYPCMVQVSPTHYVACHLYGKEEN